MPKRIRFLLPSNPTKSIALGGCLPWPSFTILAIRSLTFPSGFAFPQVLQLEIPKKQELIFEGQPDGSLIKHSQRRFVDAGILGDTVSRQSRIIDRLSNLVGHFC